jgi:TonB family protein
VTWVQFAFLAVAGGFATYQLCNAIRRNRILDRSYGWVARSERPRSFWFYVGLNALVLSGGLGLSAYEVWREHSPQSFAERAAELYPSKAVDEAVSGRVVVACTVTSTYGLRDCEVVETSPPGYHFGEAALKIASTMTLPEKDRALVRPGGIARVPIRFKMPEA